MTVDFALPKVAVLALVLTPLCAWFLHWSWGRRRLMMSLFVRARLQPELTAGLSRRRPLVKRVLLTAGLAFVLLAAARPRWGETEEMAEARGRDIVVCVDVSRSMLATDVAPSRLTRAKLACYDLISLAKGDRLGLVAFAGDAFLQCPLALDGQAFRENVAALSPDILPEQGTSVGLALDEAMEAFTGESKTSKVVILLTDGEDHEEMALSAARRLSRAGVFLFTVGVGTPAGEILKASDPYGNAVFLKDEDGNPVRSRLNEALLRQIAEACHGFYTPLKGGETMKSLYQRGIAPLEAAHIESSKSRSRVERFQWPLGAGLLLLLVELLLSEASRPSSRLRPAPSRGTARGTPSRPTATAGAALALVAAGLFLVPQVRGDAASEALRAYEGGDFATARKLYEELAQRNPDDFRLRFNAGDAAYRAKDYKAAAGHFEQVLRSPDLGLQQQAWYNLGNARFRAGEGEAEPDRRKEEWQQALSSFEVATKLDPNDPAARSNSEFVRRAIESLPPPPEDSQRKSGNDPSKKDPKKEPQKDPRSQQQNRGQSKDGSKKESGKPESKEGKPEDADSKGQDPAGNPPPQDGQDPNRPQSSKPDPRNADPKSGKGESAGEGKDGPTPSQPGQDRRDATAGEGGDEKDRRQGTLMTVREAEKVLDSQKGQEKALILQKRAGGENGQGRPTSRNRKPW